MALYIGNNKVTPILKYGDLNNQDKTITENGTYSADEGYTGLGNVVVNVAGTGIPREVSSTGKYQIRSSSFAFSLPSNVNDIDQFAMYYAFYKSTGLTSVDLSGVTTISGYSAMQSAFQSCTNLSAVNLSNLTTISGTQALYYAFSQCTKITSVDFFTNLTNISGQRAMGYAFYYCTKLKEIKFPSLTTTSFGSYTNQFNKMLANVTGCTVHFPASIEATIGSWADVTSGFGGTNTTVLFDL